MFQREYTCVLLMLAAGVCMTPVSVRAGAQSTGQVAGQQTADSPPKPRCFGKTLTQINFPNLSGPDQQVLRGLMNLHEGESLDKKRLQEAMRAAAATSRFASLRAECDPSADGNVTLSFVSQPNFFVGRVSVEGVSGRPTESQVANASKFQLGELFASDKMDRALQSIGRLMEENGFYRSIVTHSEAENAQTQQIEITFHVRPGPQARVGKVTVQGHGLFSHGQIEDIGHLHSGELVTGQTGTNAIERIRKKFQKHNRWLAQVEIASKQYQSESNTVDYVLQIDSGPNVQISIEGFHLSRGTVRRNVPVYEENALDEDLLEEGERNLLSHMQARGYFDADVELKRQSDPAHNSLQVIYKIDAGERHKVIKVEITGNKYFRDEQLRPGMQVQEASLLLLHGRFSQALLRGDIRDIENKYQANGFAQVKVDSRVEDDYHGANNQIAVFVHITEGAQTLVGSFEITGATTQFGTPLPTLNTQPGQPFSDVNVAQDRDILLNYYFNNGFPSATFEATATPAADNRMNVAFHVTEGQRTYIERVLVAGREFTKPYIIDRELEVKPDDPLSENNLLDTQQKLYDLGIFSQVDTAVQNPEGIETRKNVLVQVQEARRYTFNYGGGFEFQTGQPSINGTNPTGVTGVSPLASFEVTRLNFRGRDHTITFQSSVGRLQQRGLISYEAPRWFNNPNWKLTLTGFFDHTLDVATFTSQRLEGTVQAGEVINKFSTIDYRMNYRLVKATNINISPDQIPLLSQPVRVGEPAIAYIRNRRDNDLETTRGSYITVDAGVASSYFGSQADFSRILVQNSTYHPFGKRRNSGKVLVFARSTRIGVENPYGNTVNTQPGFTPPSNLTEIPLPERFFMGGGNAHRGFGLNQAGPRDPITGFPLGGAALFLNSLELRLPPTTLPFVQDNMSFAIFHDMGNVFTDGSHMLDSLFRWHQDKALCTQALNSPFQAGSGAALCNYNYISHAIGLGVRYKTPVGPVRFDFGYNLNPTIYPGVVQVTPVTNPPTYTFTGTKQASPFNVYFSIGQTF